MKWHKQIALAGALAMLLLGKSLDGFDRCSSRTLGSVFSFVADLCTLGESAETVSLNGAVMDEYVLRTVIGRNETEALFVAEPLNCACGH